MRCAVYLPICCLLFTVSSPRLDAACKVKTRTVVAEVVAVPVAVSIGVPVAAVAPYYYSYQQFAPSQVVDVESIASRVVEKLRQEQTETPPATKRSGSTDLKPQVSSLKPLVAQRCIQCHGGADPKAGLSLENLPALACEQKLKAVRAVLSEKMPKKGPRLTSEEAGRILEELTAQ